MAKWLEQIRAAIEASPKSRYRIAQESGISEAQISRLMNEVCGVSVETAERLAGYLGLELRPKTRKGR